MVRTAVCSMRNERPYMEDRYSICKNLLPDVHMFAVYDGHGGHTVADALACHLPDLLRARLERRQQRRRSPKTKATTAEEALDIATALTGALAGVDARAWQTSVEQLRRLSSRRRRLPHIIDAAAAAKEEEEEDEEDKDDKEGTERPQRPATEEENHRLHRCGSTACVVVMETHMLTIANVGDSRAIMRVAGRKAAHHLADADIADDADGNNNNDNIVQLTRDHKPGGAAERARIERAGGFVSTIAGVDRVMGMLSLSRAMGDWYARPYVSQTPDVTRVPLRGDEDYLLIASDGLWDVLSPRAAAAVIDRVRADRRRLALIAATAAAAVDSSSKKAEEGGGDASSHNDVDSFSSTSSQHLRVSGPSVARALVDEAIGRGSSDNITVVWVDLSPSSMLAA